MNSEEMIVTTKVKTRQKMKAYLNNIKVGDRGTIAEVSADNHICII